MMSLTNAPVPISREQSDPPSGDRASSRRTTRNPRGPGSMDAVFHESPALAAMPVGPLCDRRTLERAPVGPPSTDAPLSRIADAAGRHGWLLRHASGTLISPTYAPGTPAVVQTGAVLDVYVGLLVELARAGFPADGRVRVGRREFLARLRWNDEEGRIGGAAYAQLDAAIDYLAELRIRSTALAALMDVEAGQVTTGELTFRILQAHGRVSAYQLHGLEEMSRPGAGHRADDLIVHFSAPFVRLLQHDDHRVTGRLAHYLTFKRGSARAFYRYVSYLATCPLTAGAITVDLDTVFASIGSTVRGAPPAKLRQMLHDAPTLLVDLGLMRRLPEFSTTHTPNGVTHWVTFRPATPPSAGLKAVLHRTLTSWKVTPSVALKLIAADLEWIATIVAATTLGMLETKKSLPAMVVDYCKAPNRDLDERELPRFKPARAGQRRTATLNADMEYLEDRYTKARSHLDGLATDAREKLRQEHQALGRPDWVVDGLMLSAVHQFRGGGALPAYRTTPRARTP